MSNLVAVDYELSHYPFFRLGGGQPGIMKIPFWGGFWEVHSTDFPDFFDLDIFLGALKLYQDMVIKGKVKETALYSWKDKKTGETRERKTMCIKATRLKLCEYSDLPVNGTSYKRIDACLKKLALLTAFKVVYKKKDNGAYSDEVGHLFRRKSAGHSDEVGHPLRGCAAGREITFSQCFG